MKKIISFLISLAILGACSGPNEELTTQVSIKFLHNWNDTPILIRDLNTIKFTNANGELLSIERIRYIVSNVVLINNENEIYELSKYQLIDFGDNEVIINADEVPLGSYKLSFIFGFTDRDNTDGIYQDLNSNSFNVPRMLGGGYHFMQFDGKYLNENNQETGFNYHMIRAVNVSGTNNQVFQDTSFKVDLGVISIANNDEIKIKTDLSEWFKNPNTWDLNQLNTLLMPNFNAQVLMNQNGKSVFSLIQD
ncbi:MAG: Uncharacterised protein [Polaribacter sp. SA4-10]|nr:MAG: Uncharacterised protein [Polaribacter sp. SA4-10]